jgi:hypothetical protein
MKQSHMHCARDTVCNAAQCGGLCCCPIRNTSIDRKRNTTTMSTYRALLEKKLKRFLKPVFHLQPSQVFVKSKIKKWLMGSEFYSMWDHIIFLTRSYTDVLRVKSFVQFVQLGFHLCVHFLEKKKNIPIRLSYDQRCLTISCILFQAYLLCFIFNRFVSWNCTEHYVIQKLLIH